MVELFFRINLVIIMGNTNKNRCHYCKSERSKLNPLKVIKIKYRRKDYSGVARSHPICSSEACLSMLITSTKREFGEDFEIME